MTGRLSLLLATLAAATAAAFFAPSAAAQFREEAFSQQYNSDDPSQQDSVEVLFSLKEYFGGLGHKNELKVGNMFAGSAVFIGGSQIYNRQYWKLPIVYGTIGAGLGGGFYFRSRGDTKASTLCFIGAGAAYWATLMDGVVSYRPNDYPHAGKATLYSILVPGLGQIYNKEYWKVPIYIGGMAAGLHYYFTFSKSFERFRNIYIEASSADSSYDGPFTADQALYYRNIYRRYRDYSLLATAAVYLLQIIDANVFSYMHGFEVNDDISMRVGPAVMLPDNQLASAGLAGGNVGVGLRLGINF